jgi:dihydrofolate reductase
MLVSLIVAMDRRGLIGNETGLPWHQPRDLRRFRDLTWGKPIVMGRRTHEFIGRPLPGRENIVLTRDPHYCPAGCRAAATFPQALALAEDYLRTTGGDEVMIIGGGQVYAEAMPLWDRLYLTLVEGQFEGSTYFPIRELRQQSWRLAGPPEVYAADEKNRYPHSFCILQRLSSQPDLGQPDADDVDVATILERGVSGS